LNDKQPTGLGRRGEANANRSDEGGGKAGLHVGHPVIVALRLPADNAPGRADA
jgi:hypothetical protein